MAKDPIRNVEGCAEAKAALIPWLTERVKDSTTLGQPLVVMLFLSIDSAREPGKEQLLFSDRFGPDDEVEPWVDELLDHAADACDMRLGRQRFVVRIKDDSRSRRFVLHAGSLPDVLDSNRALISDDILLAASLDTPRTRGSVASDGPLDRVLWALFAAAAISNTAEMVKPTADGRPSKPARTGGRATVVSRQYTTVAADTVAQYATRVANEMLKSYRDRWKKRSAG